MLSKVDIVAEIHAAFGRSEPPALLVEGHEAIWKNREAFKDMDEVDVIKVFMGRPWWEIDSAYAYEGRAAGDLEMAYTYLTPAAFVYYLPSLLMLAIGPLETSNQQQAYGWIGELQTQLSPHLLKVLFAERSICFTAQQKTAITHALRYMEQAGGKKCMKPEVLQYWSQFE